MLRDSLPSYQLPRGNDLEVSQTIEVDKVFAFIDGNIASFCPYYQLEKDSQKENRISDILVHHFQLCKTEHSDGFFPFDFRKNPTQPISDKETDIGVFVMTRSRKPVPIIEFEAKRLSESSNNKEYVCGERGGIERFKRGYHAPHLNICGMFGYVQSRTSQEWIAKVNAWIDKLSKNNSDETIKWTNKEFLVNKSCFPKVEKLSSKHSRDSNTDVTLWHYFIVLN